MVGQVSQDDSATLSDIQKQSLEFINASVPKLSTWKLGNRTTQIVAGERNCFFFKEPSSQAEEQYCVWSQPWMNNFMQLTLPDGTVLTTGGL